MLRQRIDLDSGPSYSFQKVGLKNATVFTGLCAEHDRAIFERIDRHPFASDDTEQLFLYAYRAVLRETHVANEAAAKIQAVYQEKCRLGLCDANVPTPEGMFAVERMIVAYETWQFKERLDELLAERRYQGLVYDCIDLGKTAPSIAVSSHFWLGEESADEVVARVALTVLHAVDRHSYALFAYLSEEATAARKVLATLLQGEVGAARYLLSRLVLERCDNVAISPALYSSWSEGKRATIRDFWAATVLANDDRFHDRHLDLFEAP